MTAPKVAQFPTELNACCPAVSVLSPNCAITVFASSDTLSTFPNAICNISLIIAACKSATALSLDACAFSRSFSLLIVRPSDVKSKYSNNPLSCKSANVSAEMNFASFHSSCASIRCL